MPRIPSGVVDGDRTHDNRLHKPVLYQLSYDHHIIYSPETALLYQICGLKVERERKVHLRDDLGIEE